MTDISKSTVARYMGSAPETITLPKGSIVTKGFVTSMQKVFAVQPQMIEVAPNVYNFVGNGISSRTMIDAPEGLIIFDTGDDLEDGEAAYAAFREVSDRPIRAIVYSHNHYAHGTKAFIDGMSAEERENLIIIGHEDVNEHLADITSGFATGGEFPEAIGALTARYISQFGGQLPPEGPDSGAAATIPLDMEKGTVLATHTVTDGQKMTVAGLELVFYTEHFSDSEDTVTVHVPSMDLVFNNFLWPALFNFYTLRGDVFRDPASWRNGLRVIHELEPELLVNTHALPLTGKEHIRGTLERYMDSISFMIDQTLRGINKGMGPTELREFVRLPQVLQDEPHNAAIYSEFNFFAPHMYHHIFGWYDNNAAHIAKLPVDEEARRMVRGFGGAAEVARQARAALTAEDVLWATQLADYLYQTDRENPEYRQLRADTLREMAKRSSGTILRHFSLTEALACEGKIERIHTVLPSVASILQSEPGRYVNFYRVRLDPVAAEGVAQTIRIEITDHDAAFGLSIRNGVCNFSSEPARDVGATLSLTLEDWAKFYVGELSLEELIALPGARDDQQDLRKFFEMFDAVPG